MSANGLTYECRRIGQGLACASEVCDIVADEVLERNSTFRQRIAAAQFYGRFRDDLLIILRSDDDAVSFDRDMNACVPECNAVFSWDSCCVEYLDLRITLQGDRTLKFETFFKQSNLFRYLAPCSHHPKSVFVSWVKAEVRRYALTCSDAACFHSTVEAFRDRLLGCGYSIVFVNKCLWDANEVFSKREDLFAMRRNNAAPARTLALVLPFCPNFIQIGVQRMLHDLSDPVLLPHTRLVTAFSVGRPLLHVLRCPSSRIVL